MKVVRSWKSAKELIIDMLRDEALRADDDVVRVLIVKGMPGAGKTRWAIDFIKTIPGVYIVAVPRRTLREWMIRKILGNATRNRVRRQTEDIYVTRSGLTVVRFRMKYEFEDCPLSKYVGSIKDVILSMISDPMIRMVVERMPPYAAYMFFCVALCSRRREGTCPFLAQLATCVNLAMRRRHVIFVATHMGAMILSMVLRGSLKRIGKVVAVVDEFDELNALSRSFEVPRTVVDMMKRSGVEELKIIAERIENTWIYDRETDTYLPHIVRFDADIVVAISATPIEYAFLASSNAEIVATYIVPTYKPVKDVWIQLAAVHTLDDMKGMPSATVETIARIIRVANENNMTVGIIMPKKHLARLLARKLIDSGIEVYYGKSLNRAYDSRNTIIVPNDHLYRGVSIDKNVVIAFYQQWNHEDIVKNIHPEIKAYLGFRDVAIFRTAQTLCMASNVQALFRFIRNHMRRHIIVSMDRRMYEACRRFLKNYIAENIEYMEATDYSHLVELAERAVTRRIEI